jgi:CRISPR/Cas system CSM-associated protein Csm3 (group 7 of RAMP superfamily)
MSAFWEAQSARKIVRRIIIEADLILETPAHLGGGEKNGTEMLLLTDALEGKPLLTGASVAGALRHHLLRLEHGYLTTDDSDVRQNKFTWATRLFGSAYDEQYGEQSRVIVDDALGKEKQADDPKNKTPLLEIRDGVRLDGRTRTAEDQKLFSHQVWAAGTPFPLRLEVQFYESDGKGDTLLGALCAALGGFSDGSITLGARKSRGYGRVRMEQARVFDLDLKTKKGLKGWLDLPACLPLPDDTNGVIDFAAFAATYQTNRPTDHRAFFQIEATFALEDSLLIRAGSDVSQMQHLMSAGNPVLSGTSLAGALRARAVKICQTFAPPPPPSEDEKTPKQPELVNGIFGPLGDDKPNEQEERKLKGSRLHVRESVIEQGLTDWVQARVKIDRFTGGAFDTALYDQQPVFAKPETQVCLKVTLRNPQPAEIGLLLLLLKDLWTADLALGGESQVGRGRLRGLGATLVHQWEDQPKDRPKDQLKKMLRRDFTFGQPSDLLPAERIALQDFVQAFVDSPLKEVTHA